MVEKTWDLVGGLEHDFYDFPFSWEYIIIIPTDEVIFFRGVGIPPTRESDVKLELWPFISYN